MATRKSTKNKRQQRKGRSKPGRKRSATTLFVLSKPAGMPAADVVKAAAAQGITLTTARVHTIRGRYQGKAVAVAQRDVPAAKARGKRYRSASEFVREQPLDKPSKEVVAAGAKVGLKLSQGLVRVIRFHMRHQRSGTQATTGRRPRGRPPATAAFTHTPGASEAQFRKLVVELGVARAQMLVAEVERAVAAFLSRS
jgi:hypothetical protein